MHLTLHSVSTGSLPAVQRLSGRRSGPQAQLLLQGGRRCAVLTAAAHSVTRAANCQTVLEAPGPRCKNRLCRCCSCTGWLRRRRLPACPPQRHQVRHGIRTAAQQAGVQVDRCSVGAMVSLLPGCRPRWCRCCPVQAASSAGAVTTAAGAAAGAAACAAAVAQIRPRRRLLPAQTQSSLWLPPVC